MGLTLEGPCLHLQRLYNSPSLYSTACKYCAVRVKTHSSSAALGWTGAAMADSASLCNTGLSEPEPTASLSCVATEEDPSGRPSLARALELASGVWESSALTRTVAAMADPLSLFAGWRTERESTASLFLLASEGDASGRSAMAS